MLMTHSGLLVRWYCHLGPAWDPPGILLGKRFLNGPNWRKPPLRYRLSLGLSVRHSCVSLGVFVSPRARNPSGWSPTPGFISSLPKQLLHARVNSNQDREGRGGLLQKP